MPLLNSNKLATPLTPTSSKGHLSYHVIRLWATPHETRSAFPFLPLPLLAPSSTPHLLLHHHETRHRSRSSQLRFLRHRHAHPPKQHPSSALSAARPPSPLQGSQFGAPIAGRRNQDCFLFVSFSFWREA